MDANSTREAPSPPLKIHLFSSSPGSTVPIRAPLTIDSDSEFCLSINDQIHSRTNSFGSNSSIDIGSYGDERISVHEEEDGTFVAYPDEEIVIGISHVEDCSYTRPFVKYPDGEYVKESSNVDESAIFRPFVKISHEESSSDIEEFAAPPMDFVKPVVTDFGIFSPVELGVPVAPLTSDGDSDIDSVGSEVVDGRWLDSLRIPAAGILQKVAMAPKVGVFGGVKINDEKLHFEGVCFGDESKGAMNDFVLAESIEDEGPKIECSNEVLELSGSHEIRILGLDEQRGGDEMNFDSQRIDAQIVSDSDNEVKIINGNEREGVFDSSSKESDKSISEKEEQMLLKMQPIRTKFLKFVRLLGLSTHDSTVVQVLCRLALGKQLAMEVDGEDGNDGFDFCLTILAIGKTGVGKSATLNSILGENKALTDAFHPATTTVKEIVGSIDGVRLRVVDTPGLRCSPSEQSYNRRILSSIKKFTRKHTPDVVLYVDRLDTHTQDLNDLRLLRLITSSLGSSVWCNCVIALTHAVSSPPDEPSGGFVLQRCRFIQQLIVSLAAGDRHMANPVCLVENHPSYKQEKSWRAQLLLLCYSAKILHEANSVVKTPLHTLDHGELFEFGDRLCHSIDLDAEFMCLACRNQEDGDECDQVLRFKPLGKSQNATKHSQEHKKAYFKEHGYRVKLLGKKHWSLVCRFYL